MTKVSLFVFLALLLIVFSSSSLIVSSACSGDIDCDGIYDWFDNCKFIYNPTQLDSDNDFVGNACDACPNQPGPREDNGCPDECEPSAEICNGIDDDCDEQTDEGLGSTSCGVGACRRTVQNCVNGQQQQCVPGNPSPENCNDNIDNDCDGTINDGCQQCIPSTEVCNGRDDDCDQQIDEGFSNENCRPRCEANGFVWTGNGGNLNCFANNS